MVVTKFLSMAKSLFMQLRQFTGWYTADGVRVEGDIKLTNDFAIYAKFFAGDVDGND